jgi:hypothetical protein
MTAAMLHTSHASCLTFPRWDLHANPTPPLPTRYLKCTFNSLNLDIPTSYIEKANCWEAPAANVVPSILAAAAAVFAMLF